MKNTFFNQKGKNHRYIYFIIVGLLLGSFFGALIHNQVDALSFGDSGSTGNAYTSIENVCVAGYYKMGNHNGIANNISVCISTGLLYSGNARCKLYYGSNGTAVTNGETISSTVTSGLPSFFTFIFINPKPILKADTYYYISILAQSLTGNCRLLYLSTGNSTTTSKTATYDTFPTSWTSYTNIDTSSTPRIYCSYEDIIPNSPSVFNSINKSGTTDTISLTWIKGDYATHTRIMYKKTYFPSSITDGILAYNNTGTSYDLTGLDKNTIYFFSAWGYDGTYWSTSYYITCNRTVTIISGSTALTVYNNTAHTTGNYATSYNSTTGNKIWLNFTGALPIFNHYENIINATGTHQYNTVNSGYTINSWANYTGNTSGVSSYANKTIYIFLNGHGFFDSWNGSVNTNIQNISILMDSNKTITGNFTENETYNEDNYFLSGILIFDNFQFSLLILLSIWIFFLSQIKNDDIFGLFQLFIGLPLCSMMGAYAYLNSLPYSYFVSLAILIVTLLSLAFVYWKPKKK